MVKHVIDDGTTVVCSFVVLAVLAVAIFVFFTANNGSKQQQEEEIRKEMVNNVSVSPWPNDKDVFVVADVVLIGDTNIRNVVVKRQDGRYFSALSGRDDIRKGSVVKLAFLKRLNNSNGAYGAVPIIKEVIKEAKKTEKPN